jgi:integrase
VQVETADTPQTIADLKARSLANQTLGDLLNRYLTEIIPRKRGRDTADTETPMISALLREPLAALSLAALTAKHLSDYRDARLRGTETRKAVKASTLRREFTVLRHCFEVARKEWAIPVTNPVLQVRLPSNPDARCRRLEPHEIKRFADALAATSLPYLRPFVLLAVETGMRRGEILGLTWTNINLKARTAYLPLTKNGHSRTVPLSPQACGIIEGIPRTGDKLFENVTPNAVRLAWGKIRSKAALSDLRIHDLRHEAISRFFELGLSTPEVALISGHRDYRMLARYTHLRPTDIAAKLAVLSACSPAGED